MIKGEEVCPYEDKVSSLLATFFASLCSPSIFMQIKTGFAINKYKQINYFRKCLFVKLMTIVYRPKTLRVRSKNTMY